MTGLQGSESVFISYIDNINVVVTIDGQITQGMWRPTLGVSILMFMEAQKTFQSLVSHLMPM